MGYGTLALGSPRKIMIVGSSIYEFLKGAASSKAHCFIRHWGVAPGVGLTSDRPTLIGRGSLVARPAVWDHSSSCDTNVDSAHYT